MNGPIGKAHDGGGGSGRPRLGGAGRGALVLLLAVTALLAGCSQPSRDGRETEVRRPAAPARPPIVLLPGVSREVARVMRGGTLVPFSTLALRTDAEALAHLGDPRFPADGSWPAELPARLDNALRGTDVRGLQGLVDRLVREEGYVRGDPENPRDKDYPENPPGERTDRTRVASLFVLYYDWRRDVADSACFVADRIGRIREATGAPRVLLVGHSLGGLVARYYLRYGGRDAMRDRDCPVAQRATVAAVNAPGAAAVSRLAVLGAPHRGSVQAFRALLQDFRLFGLLSLGLREAVFTMPLAWQLLPFADRDGQVPLLVDGSREEPVALFRLRTWVERGWLSGKAGDADRLRFVEAMLERARAFQRRMAGRHSAEEAVPRLVVGGDCRPTLARAIVTDSGPEFLSRDQLDDPGATQAIGWGDGVVTAESALGLPPSPTLTTFSVCSRHSAYVDDPGTTTRVIRFLLSEEGGLAARRRAAARQGPLVP